MNIKDIIPTGPVHARIAVPGSKSMTNRALICAALAKGESTLHNASDSDDTALMANGLNQFGVLVRQREKSLVVSGTGGKLYAPKFPIPVGNAGPLQSPKPSSAHLLPRHTCGVPTPRPGRPNKGRRELQNKFNPMRSR